MVENGQELMFSCADIISFPLVLLTGKELAVHLLEAEAFKIVCLIPA